MSNQRRSKQQKNDGDVPDTGRRQAVKTMVGGLSALAAYQVLPAKWGAPVIQSLLLPAHAATSGISLHDPCMVTVVGGDQNTRDVTVRVTGFVTPPTGDLSTTIAVVPVGGGAGETITTRTAADGTFTAERIVSGGPGITRITATTTVAGALGSTSCSAVVPEPERNNMELVTFAAAGVTGGTRAALTIEVQVHYPTPPAPSFIFGLQVSNTTTNNDVLILLEPVSEAAPLISGTYIVAAVPGDLLVADLYNASSWLPSDFDVINIPRQTTVVPGT